MIPTKKPEKALVTIGQNEIPVVKYREIKKLNRLVNIEPVYKITYKDVPTLNKFPVQFNFLVLEKKYCHPGSRKYNITGMEIFYL